MKFGRIRFVGCALALGLAAHAPTVQADNIWKNHVDVSLVNEMVERDGVLYMATAGGLLRYDIGAGRFQQFTNDTGLPSNTLTSLAFHPSGAIYAGTDDIGVSKIRVQGDLLTLLRSLNEQIDGLTSNAIRSLAVWGDDIVYGAERGMGTIVNDFAAVRMFASNGLPSDVVNDVFVFDDEVWIGTPGGIVVMNRLNLLRSVAGAPGNALVFGSDGQTLWVGTSAGVFRFDPSDSSWTDLGLSSEPIFSFAFDGVRMRAGGRLSLLEYAGTGTSWNLARLDSFTLRYGLTGSAVETRGLAVVGGDVFAGGGVPGEARGYNLMRYDGSTIVNHVPNAPGANQIGRLSRDVDGSVWASFFPYYVGKLETDDSWVNYNSSIPLSDSLTNRFVNLVCMADLDGRKWFGTLSSNTARALDVLDDQLDDDYTNDIWQHLAVGSGGGDGLGSPSFQRATVDPLGNRWFLSDAAEFGVTQGWWGMNILSRDTSQWMRMNPLTEPRMVDGNVVDVTFAPTAAYLAYRNWGVQRWFHGGYDWANLSNRSADGWSTIARAGVGAMSNVSDLLAVEVTRGDVLWVGTNDGVFRIAPSLLVDHIRASNGFSVGLLSPQVRDIALDHDENLWVATEFGLNRIARDNVNDIQSFTTPAAYQEFLADLRYPTSIISPLVHANCSALLLHATRDILYVGTAGGLSVLTFAPSAPTAPDLSRVYLYPNPVYTGKGHSGVKIENLSGPVSVEVYDLEGELVHSQSATQPGQQVWDLTTSAGALASSGTYLVRISAESATVVKTIVVVR